MGPADLQTILVAGAANQAVRTKCFMKVMLIIYNNNYKTRLLLPTIEEVLYLFRVQIVYRHSHACEHDPVNSIFCESC